MTCRHRPGDPNCSSSADYARLNPPEPKTPDKSKYSILDIHRIENNVVLKVNYPNCKRCSYEGTKIMVFMNVTEADILKWKEIDPHFRDPKNKTSLHQAPGPVARFPASEEGWKDAIEYLNKKSMNNK